jgi:mRNA interferase MazF
VKPYEPEAGDLVWIDFEPRLGREQGGRRPALVLSARAFYRASRFVIVCPITSNVRSFRTSVVLPKGSRINGEVLTSHVRSIDTIARPVAYAGERVAEAILAEARAKLATLIGL